MVVLKWFLFCRNFVSLNYLHVGKKKRLRRLYFASRRSCLGNPFPADVSDCRLYHSHYNKCLYIWVCLRLSPLHFHWRCSNVLKKFSGCLYLSICVSLKMRPMCIVIFRRALNETEKHFTAVRAEQTETSLQKNHFPRIWWCKYRRKRIAMYNLAPTQRILRNIARELNKEPIQWNTSPCEN